MKLLGFIVAGGMCLLTAGAFAQSTVNTRRQDQQDRIANGVQSGQLTAGETKSLEQKQGNLNREIHADRTADGGYLTSAERNRINRQQNHLSNQI